MGRTTNGSSISVEHVRGDRASSRVLCGTVLLVALALGDPRSLGAVEAPIVEDLGDGFLVRELIPGYWMATLKRPWSANSLVAGSKGGVVVLADTPPTEATTRRLLEWVDERLSPSSIVAMVSHYHVDALGGNRVLKERGIPIYGHHSTPALLDERGDRLLASVAEEHPGVFDQERLVAPTELVPDAGLTLELGDGRVVELIFPGAGHAPDNLVAWFPRDRVLFGGCSVKTSGNVGYLGDANLETWPGAVERLQALEPEVVVGGHGDATDPANLAITLEVVRAAAIDAAIEASATRPPAGI